MSDKKSVNILMINKLKQILDKNGHDLTKPRKSVFNFFLKYPTIPASELFKKLVSTGKVDRASTYRALELFVNLDVLRKNQLLGIDVYELGIKFRKPKIYFVCIECKKINAHLSERIESDVKELASYYSFDVKQFYLNIDGICQKCSNKIKNQ